MLGGLEVRPVLALEVRLFLYAFIVLYVRVYVCLIHATMGVRLFFVCFYFIVCTFVCMLNSCYYGSAFVFCMLLLYCMYMCVYA